MSTFRSLFVLFFTFLVTTVVESTDECISSTVFSTIIVDKSSYGYRYGYFGSIQAAIDSVPDMNNQWIHIVVKPGTYNEKVLIPAEKPCIFLEGFGTQTSIEWNDHVPLVTSANFSIMNSGTFITHANNIVVKNMIFKNTYNLLPASQNKRERARAPAVAIYGDKNAFYSCAFISLQDTLFDQGNRHYFKACLIEGVVDFIFGVAQSIYEDCKIHVAGNQLLRQKFSNGIGYITANGRNSSDDESGFVFKRGKIYGSGRAYLGRAWGLHSRVIFYGTEFSNVVHPLGWDSWDKYEHKNNFTYVEANCSGPGSEKSRRVNWRKELDEPMLQKFTNLSYIDEEGWIQKQPFH